MIFSDGFFRCIRIIIRFVERYKTVGENSIILTGVFCGLHIAVLSGSWYNVYAI